MLQYIVSSAFQWGILVDNFIGRNYVIRSFRCFSGFELYTTTPCLLSGELRDCEDDAKDEEVTKNIKHARYGQHDTTTQVRRLFWFTFWAFYLVPLHRKKNLCEHPCPFHKERKRVIFHCRHFQPHANTLFLTQDIAVVRKISLLRMFSSCCKDTKMPCNNGKLLHEVFALLSNRAYCIITLKMLWQSWSSSLQLLKSFS